MDFLQSLDVAGFRFVHEQLRNRVLDLVLPYFSWNPLFVPALLLLGFWLAWKGGARGRVFVAMLVLAIIVGDGVICNALKHAVARERPFMVVAGTEPLVGLGTSGSMPSSHTASWFAAATLGFIYFRRIVWLLLPLALIVGFSRMYLGVHYPSDVLVGAVLGVAYTVAMTWVLDRTWNFAGKKWFPSWYCRFPSVLKPTIRPSVDSGLEATPPKEDLSGESARPWLRLGYVLIGVLLLFRLGYIASNKIELSEDEAYQWVWSKHLALSYYSKPPLIAYTQFLGTSLWGDNEFGVRFFSPVIASIIGFLLLRFFAREANARAGFYLLAVVTATPLLAVGATLMTIDPLSVLFWTAAMLAGWNAVRSGSTSAWLWTGLWMGLGFLSKYTALLQLICWAIFFALDKPARRQLRRPGPYLACLIIALCALPVVIWNFQHDWITVSHLFSRAGLQQPWDWRRSASFFRDFLLAEAALLNPVFFVAMAWAAWGIWKERVRSPVELFLFSMGTPLFLIYLLYTIRARVLPNWIAPALLPLLCLMVIRGDRKWRAGMAAVTRWLAAGLTIGMVMVVLLHETNLIAKIIGRPLPANKDPLTRVRGWRETARVVGEARASLLREDQPVIIIGDHYGITGLLSFYLPEAKACVSSRPMVYYEAAATPENQFYFWRNYLDRKGQNAIFVQTSKEPAPAPLRIRSQFQSVTDLGMKEIFYRGRAIHRIQLFECRGLR